MPTGIFLHAGIVISLIDHSASVGVPPTVKAYTNSVLSGGRILFYPVLDIHNSHCNCFIIVETGHALSLRKNIMKPAILSNLYNSLMKSVSLETPFNHVR